MATGRLFVVATPIGNLEDISARALRVLGTVKLIAAEDTRHSRRLLDHFQIATPLTSYHDHNERTKSETLLAALLRGDDVALITDAGTPCISDPGYRIVRAAHDVGIAVVAIPGPSAMVAAVSVSGLPSDRVTFHGFFPRKLKDARATLGQMLTLGGTHVFYESPNRLLDTLALVQEMEPPAEVCVARELTKVHEEVVRGTAGEVAAHFGSGEIKGECVLLVHLDAAVTVVDDDAIRAAVDAAMTDNGMSRRDAVRAVAESLRVPRNRVYQVAGEA